MTSAEIRQSFLDFFASQGHTIVPSSSLLPDSPGLLFTNAGMNQFVPIFLGDKAADVSKWAGARPAKDTRAADTQKCIRAGGKHNDLEDVGYDTYHHTLFEMLGNWSFGDYFKKESLTWGWHLLTKVWGIPAKRLYATVYAPKPGDPSEFDHEAAAIWTELFKAAGLDPALHIVHGNRKDNFWQMGDTGPCGPCSEIHFNLEKSDDEVEGRKGVNSSSPRCIEIWNHVFIQFNANADCTFSPLAAKHVDTGMGFERVAGIHATTKGFTDFSPEPSNYNADVFAPLFAKVTALSGKTYTGTVPTKREGLTEQENIDIAFRVLADHARTISCSIADGIMPGNEGRNYVIRRILRRGILYGTKLGLKTGFFEQLVAPVVESLGNVFPELVERQDIIRRVIKSEEESFGRTIERGLNIFNERAKLQEALGELNHSLHESSFIRLTRSELKGMPDNFDLAKPTIEKIARRLSRGNPIGKAFYTLTQGLDADTRIDADIQNYLPLLELFATVNKIIESTPPESAEAFYKLSAEAEHLLLKVEKSLVDSRLNTKVLPGAFAFKLYDTYGFPLDMTQLLATERGLTVDTAEFERLMDEQRKRGQASTKKTIVVAATEGSDTIEITPTIFVGYEKLTAETTLLDIVKTEKDTYLVFAETPFYAEMGGQLGDTGDALISGHLVHITDTVKDKSGRYLHKMDSTFVIGHSSLVIGSPSTLSVDATRRRAINRHHTATHLLHWALRKVLGTHVRQAGSLNAPDRLRFDFAHFEAVTSAQLREIEGLVNERVLENAAVASYETEFDKKPEGTLAFFGEKYGKTVRVVDTGGYSRELCGGTHVSTTGEIGLVKIISEGAVAAGTRRLEAVAGQAAYDHVSSIEQQLAVTAAKIGVPVSQLDLKLDSLLAHKAEADKKLKAFEQRAIATLANDLAFKAVTKDGLPHVSAVVTVEAPEALREIGSQVLARLGGEGVVVIGAAFGPEKLSLVAFASPAAIKAGHQAGKIISALTAQLGGKGGGKPDFAMGGGKDVAKLSEVLG